MIIWVITFPKGYVPRKIAFKSHAHACKVFDALILKPNSLTCMFLEEDELRIPFLDYEPSSLGSTL